MEVIRAFIAINLSPDVLERIGQVALDLKKRMNSVPIRWVPTENIHLTLKFLGNVSTANLELLKDILGNVASNHHECDISVGGIGVFPKPHNPRVIWVGMEVPQELFNLQREIEIETARMGYSREHRPFSPHLTFGRVSRNASTEDVHIIAESLENYKVGFLGATRVRTVYLFRSDLKPEGAEYTPIYSAALNEGDSIN
ncbi:MAG: RNA 2',3'-cyclic phosphodiesterase [Anaerolineales bacterium]|jgi:2'-5' RNA ligase|nr:RNA 2',3'-cyclic phosphodiesterase [Anaerolineales bacterium]